MRNTLFGHPVSQSQGLISRDLKLKVAILKSPIVDTSPVSEDQVTIGSERTSLDSPKLSLRVPQKHADQLEEKGRLPSLIQGLAPVVVGLATGLAVASKTVAVGASLSVLGPALGIAVATSAAGLGMLAYMASFAGANGMSLSQFAGPAIPILGGSWASIAGLASLALLPGGSVPLAVGVGIAGAAGVASGMLTSKVLG